uniref:Tetratricopeptide repeat protein 36 n=1 Tax=Plectus sambesii TaxID=2011161 RepID=A0A914X1W6_9BILA
MTTPNDRAVLNHILNPLLPAEVSGEDDPIVEEESGDAPANLAEVKRLEIEGVKAAEAKQLDEAVSLLTRAVDLCPTRASTFNNRAQVLRLRGNVEEALNDLNKAIELSGGKGKAACQAYVQRAMIARLQNRDADAKADYEKAAEMGSSFAKMQLIAMNPYAAMCNKMLAEVMTKLQRGEPTDQELDHAG